MDATRAWGLATVCAVKRGAEKAVLRGCAGSAMNVNPRRPGAAAGPDCPVAGFVLRRGLVAAKFEEFLTARD